LKNCFSQRIGLPSFHTLLQPEDGVGGMIVIDPECRFFDCGKVS